MQSRLYGRLYEFRNRSYRHRRIEEQFHHQRLEYNEKYSCLMSSLLGKLDRLLDHFHLLNDDNMLLIFPLN
jgi:hypothetical protein